MLFNLNQVYLIPSCIGHWQLITGYGRVRERGRGRERGEREREGEREGRRERERERESILFLSFLIIYVLIVVEMATQQKKPVVEKQRHHDDHWDDNAGSDVMSNLEGKTFFDSARLIMLITKQSSNNQQKIQRNAPFSIFFISINFLFLIS